MVRRGVHSPWLLANDANMIHEYHDIAEQSREVQRGNKQHYLLLSGFKSLNTICRLCNASKPNAISAA
jgi:hypothetical protein